MLRKSAGKKYLRQSFKRREKNRALKNKIKKAIKEYLKLVASSDIEKAKAKLPGLYKLLDKAGKTFLSKITSSRKKSQLAKKLNIKKS